MSTEFFNDQWRIPSNENQNKVSNYSMEFDGTSSYIDCGDSDKFSFGDGATDRPFSVSAWVNMTDATRFRIVNKGANFSNDYEYVFTTSGSDLLALNLYDSSTGARIAREYSTALTSFEGQWIHLVASYDGSETSNGIKIYLNGSRVDNNTNDLNPGDYTAMENGTNPLEIGAQTVGSKFSNGQIDQVTVFDYALSQDQVTQLGAEGYAFNFIPNDYIDLGTTTAYDTGDLSAAIWVNASSSRTSTIYAFSNSGSPAFAGFDFVIYTNNEIRIRRSTTTKSNTTNQINIGFVSDTWQHLALTYSESTNTLKLFLNGVLKATNVGTNQTNTASKKLTIGSYKGASAFFDGELSNAQVLNSKLEDSEIATLYNNGKPLADMSSFTSLQGWWKLDDTATFNSSTSVWTIPDDSSNSNNGTSVGMNASSLVASNINGELIANPMITSPKPIAYYQLGDQSAYNGSNYLVPNNSLSDYNLKWVKNNSSYNAGDSINIPGINKALAGATSMSMTFWVYLDPAVYPNGIVFRMNNSPGSMSFSFVRYGNSRGPVWVWSIGDGTNVSGPAGSKNVVRKPNFYNSDFVSSPTGGSNIWWNITCTWDGSTMKVYRNAVTQSSRWGTYTGTIPSSTNATAFLGATKVGSNSSVANELFLNGRLSNVAFWRNYTLTQDEATEVYNNGAPLDLNSFSGAAPEAWYKLDSSEIFNNASTEWSVDNNAYPSVYKSSLNFNGNDYINCGTGSRFNIDQITISAWVKRNSSIGNYAVAAGVRNTNNGPSPYIINLSTASSKLIKFVITQSNSTGIIVNSNTLIEDDIWYHVVGVADGSNVLIYVNGDLQTDQKTYDGTIISPTQNFNIGRQPSASTYYWNGELSNVAVFDTGLSLSQVETLYNNGTPEASISHSPLSWWKLDNTTTGIQDSAGSNDGTSNGATEYAGFVNSLAGESSNMDSSNLVVSDLQQTSGYSPYALSLDGINDVLTIQNSSTFNLGTAFAISGWFNFSSNKYQGLISFDATSGGSPRGWFLFQIPTNNEIRFFDGTNTRTLKTSYTTTNQWDSFIITYDGTDLVFYINGNQESTQAVSVDLQTNGNDGQIGNNQYASGRFFDGKVSNIALWNVGLSSTQVTEIYNEGVPSNLHNFSGTAPVSWWQLGSNSSYNSSANTWTCLDEIGTNNAVSAGNMTNDDIVDGVGYSASGLGSSSIDIKGDAPYSTANGLSENMDVLDRTLDTPIRNTHSLELDGVDDHVSFSQTFFASNYEVSYSFWVKPDTYVDTIGYLIGGTSNLAGGIGYSQGYNAGSYSPGRVLYYTGQGVTYTNAYLTENVWNNLVVTFGNPSTSSNRVMKVYKNGVLQSTHTGGFFGTYSQIFNIIGKAWANPVNGKMDEVAIFSSELSAPQVASIYNNGTPGNILPLNPALWYRFESTTDNNGVIEVSDDSGNGKTGELKNGASLSTVVP